MSHVVRIEVILEICLSSTTLVARFIITFAAALNALMFSIAAASLFLPIFLTEPGASRLMRVQRTTPSWRKFSKLSRSPLTAPVKDAIHVKILASVSALRDGWALVTVVVRKIFQYRLNHVMVDKFFFPKDLFHLTIITLHILISKHNGQD